MDKYKCKQQFTIDMYDEDGFPMENEHVVVEEDSVWEEEGTRQLSEVRLSKVDSLEWIEITKESLNEYFDKM